MLHHRSPALWGLALCFAAAAAQAVDTQDTRMLVDPSASSTDVAFLYAGDVWTAKVDGSAPRRLTAYEGTERAPRLSGDGKLVAFTGEYDGNADVYVVPVDGGEPRRLTWHPALDVVWGFTPDSKAVVFGSPRDNYSGVNFQVYTVSVDGGFPQKLPVPRGFYAAFSPDAKLLAYNPTFQSFRQWKNYRGGRASRIWVQDLADDSVVEVPQAEGRSNDTDPMWVGNAEKLYFRSDRAGEFNLFSYDFSSGEVRQHTHFEDFPVLNASASGGRIAFEQAGYVHLFDPRTDTTTRLRIGIATDLIERRPRWEKGDRFLRNHALSPSGARAAFEFRGEIVTVPAEKGDVRNITNTVAVHERDPVWSPDGKSIAYFSDASGEYALHVAAQDGHGETRVIELAGAGFYDTPKFSPDSKWLSYIDNSQSIYVLDLDSGKTEKVVSEILYSPDRTLHHSWSPDSKWLVYTRVTRTFFQVVALYSLDEKRSYELSDGLADVSEPVFDASGKYLYFAASTDAGPVRQWFAQSNADMEITSSLYLAVLKKDELSPLAPESDEEKGKDEEKKDGDEEKKDEKGKKEEKKEEKGKKEEEKRVTLDVEGLGQRIVALPVGPAAYSRLQAGEEGKLFYVRRDAGSSGSEGGELMVFDLKKREAESLLSGVLDFELSGDRKKVLVSTAGGFSIADAGGKIDAGKGKIATDAIQVKIDPVAEWPQIYNEAWRINRDYFYDPGMHGADWEAVREKYAQFLPHLSDRNDLFLVIRWMLSELSVGHSGQRPGDSRYDAESIPGGLLGADFEIADGKYRFKKVFGGLNWNPDLRAPLTEPGVGVEAGDYLLAVDGVALDASENVYSRFEATADKIVELEVGPSPDGEGSRTVRVVPVADEGPLRNRDWVESNIRKVDEATGGRVAYVYVPNTAGRGHTYFKRYFFPQAYKEAILVDERFNGGGSIADYYIDILRRPLIAFWSMRYGEELKTPIASIQGPKAMLTDEVAGSGGDLLPWMFRKLGLGPLIGKRTWGGLVGVLGFPVLMDGGSVTAPNIGFWTPEEGYGVENVGVPPDIEVEQWPAEVNAGHDPQLERAIDYLLGELKKNPPPTYEKPPFPIRVRR